MRCIVKILSLVSVFGFAAAGCISPLPPQEPVAVNPLQYSSTETQGIENVIVVTDASNSLYLNRSFPEAKAFTEGFIASMPEPVSSYEAAGIGFGGRDRLVAPLAPFDRDRLLAKADQLKPIGGFPGGMTPLHNVFDEIGTALRGKSGKTAVLLVSDVAPDAPDQAVEAAQRLVANYKDGICLHIIRVGDEAQSQAFAERLAAVSSCGSVNDVAQLQSGEAMTAFTRQVFATEVELPAVAAGPPCEATVTLRGVGFAFDKADLTPDSAGIIDEAARHMRECASLSIEIGGHTDSVGAEAYNDGLSKRRAEAVKQQLIEAGVDSSRMVTRGFGETNPVAPNETTEGRAQNRRVELVPLR